MKYTVVELTRATRAWADDGWVWIHLEDGREIRFPATKNRKLHKASPKQLNHIELVCDGTGLHWPDLDEDLSVDGILEGRLGLE